MNESRMKTELDESLETHEFEVFFDGECPLCKREIAWLEKKDKHERIRFTDLSEESFDPSRVGRSLDELMRSIHGRVLSGERDLVTGVEVFRQIYGRLGFSWIVAVTRWPIVRHFFDFAYFVFAKLRYWNAKRRCDDRCAVKLKPELVPSSDHSAFNSEDKPK